MIATPNAITVRGDNGVCQAGMSRLTWLRSVPRINRPYPSTLSSIPTWRSACQVMAWPAVVTLMPNCCSIGSMFAAVGAMRRDGA